MIPPEITVKRSTIIYSKLNYTLWVLTWSICCNSKPKKQHFSYFKFALNLKVFTTNLNKLLKELTQICIVVFLPLGCLFFFKYKSILLKARENLCTLYILIPQQLGQRPSPTPTTLLKSPWLHPKHFSERVLYKLSHLKLTPTSGRTDPIMFLLVTRLAAPLTFIVTTRSDAPVLRNVRIRR